MRFGFFFSSGLLALALSGCATYTAAPLPKAPSLVSDASSAPLGWTLDDLVIRALRDNPDLRASRGQQGVAEAQRLQAGLLPDPTFTGAILPLVAGVGTTTAWNAAISEDIRALVTLHARREGARAAAFQVNAQVLWQEWQTASQARLLAVQIIEGERALAFQRENLQLLADRNGRLQSALNRGDVTLVAAAPNLAALQTARAQVEAAQRQQSVRRHQLNALLGRDPEAVLPLPDHVELPEPDLAEVQRSSASLAARRPDLIALRLGYRAQEAKTRLAVLMQFPAFNLGVTGGSDNSDVRNLGPQVSTTLPIFERNRGDIAIQKATREQLRAEYQARLDAAYGQLRSAITELRATEGALSAVRADLPGALAMRDRASRSLNAGTLDEIAYVDLAGAYSAKAAEATALEQTVFEQRLSIAAITGAGLPTVQNLPDSAL